MGLGCTSEVCQEVTKIPVTQSISVQISAARRAGWGQLQTPRVGCSDGGTFRERLYNVLPSE